MSKSKILLGLAFAVIGIIFAAVIASAPSGNAPSTASGPTSGFFAAEYISDDLPDPGDRYQEGKYKLERFSGNGRTRILALQNKYDDITIWLDGKIQVPGTYGDDCPKAYQDGCYDFENKRLYFNQPPKSGTTIVVKGFPVATASASPAAGTPPPPPSAFR